VDYSSVDEAKAVFDKQVSEKIVVDGNVLRIGYSVHKMQCKTNHFHWKFVNLRNPCNGNHSQKKNFMNFTIIFLSYNIF